MNEERRLVAETVETGRKSGLCSLIIGAEMWAMGLMLVTRGDLETARNNVWSTIADAVQRERLRRKLTNNEADDGIGISPKAARRRTSKNRAGSPPGRSPRRRTPGGGPNKTAPAAG
jgi:hypothetical protein